MNSDLSKVFLKLAGVYQEKGDKFRSTAYARAAKVLLDHPVKITSGKEAIKLSGIGKSISEKIDEYIQTGTLSVFSTIDSVKPKDSMKDMTIELFKTIDGVGDVTATRWYNEGYRTLEDLKTVSMNERQTLGLKYYDDLHCRIPREEIHTFKKKFEELFPTVKFEICGSYRRGTPDSGDIDVLLCDTNLTDIVDTLITAGIIRETFSCGEKKFTGLIRLRGYKKIRHLDIMLISSSSWPFALLHFTGSVDSNVRLRQRALELNLTLNEYGLYNSNGESIPASTEQEIFSHLGLEYLPPQNR